MLDTLASCGIPAAFFVVGSKLADRALEEGAHFSGDFPSSCVVLEHGVPQGPPEAYVRATS